MSYFTLESTLLKWSFESGESNKNLSIFDFCCDIFISLLMGHHLKNGNKRFSLSFLVNMLRSFGYHFKWTWGEMQDYVVHEEQIESFVLNLQGGKIKENKHQVAQWIKKNSVVSIP